MILASIEGTIFAAVIAVVMVVVRWLSERAAKNRAEEQQQQKPPPREAAKRDSEEERMRRFMEALGIPSDGMPSATPTAPPVRQPSARREPPTRPVPPIVMREYPSWPKKTPVPPPIPRSAGKQVPPPARPFVSEERASESAPAPSIPAGRIQLPELKTTVVEEFHTATSSVSAIPNEVQPLQELVVSPISDTVKGKVKERELWQEALRSPGALRSAFILKEILGTPRGLQSAGGTHSFPSL